MLFWTEEDAPLNICYDNVFKSVFTKDTSASRSALSALVSAITGRTLFIAAISANEPAADNVRDRQIRYDISCKSESGELVNVEMTLNPDKYENARIEFYGTKLFSAQDIRGVGKSFDDLCMAYQISFIVVGRLFADDYFFHRFEYYDKGHGVSLEGRSRILTVELSKLERVVEKPALSMTPAEEWAVYFRYLTDRGKRGKINELIEREEGIKMANEVLIRISRDEVERARLMSEYKYEVDTQSKLVTARREGIAQGRAEGREEGMAEGLQKGMAEAWRQFASKALAEGLPLETIQKISGMNF